MKLTEKKLEQKNLARTDEDINTSLAEYTSLWRTSKGITLIKSDYNYEEDTIIYKSINFKDKVRIIDFIDEELDEEILGYIGIKESKRKVIADIVTNFKREEKEELFNKCLNLISGILDYTYLGYKLKEAETPQQILKNENII